MTNTHKENRELLHRYGNFSSGRIDKISQCALKDGVKGMVRITRLKPKETFYAVIFHSSSFWMHFQPFSSLDP